MSGTQANLSMLESKGTSTLLYALRPQSLPPPCSIVSVGGRCHCHGAEQAGGSTDVVLHHLSIMVYGPRYVPQRIFPLLWLRSRSLLLRRHQVQNHLRPEVQLRMNDEGQDTIVHIKICSQWYQLISGGYLNTTGGLKVCSPCFHYNIRCRSVQSGKARCPQYVEECPLDTKATSLAQSHMRVVYSSSSSPVALVPKTHLLLPCTSVSCSMATRLRWPRMFSIWVSAWLRLARPRSLSHAREVRR